MVHQEFQSFWDIKLDSSDPTDTFQQIKSSFNLHKADDDTLESALQATVQNIDCRSRSFIRWWEPVCWASEAAHGGQWSPTVCSSQWSRRLSSEPRALPPLRLPGQSLLDPEPAAYGHWHKTNIWHLKTSIKSLKCEEYWLFATAVSENVSWSKDQNKYDSTLKSHFR